MLLPRLLAVSLVARAGPSSWELLTRGKVERVRGLGRVRRGGGAQVWEL